MINVLFSVLKEAEYFLEGILFFGLFLFTLGKAHVRCMDDRAIFDPISLA